MCGWTDNQGEKPRPPGGARGLTAGRTTRVRPAVALSISESPDMAALGMGDMHLRDAMYEIVTHLLANGFDLAYGGDLRPGGLTESLSELLLRYRGRGPGGEPSITNYLAWPAHIGMGASEIGGIVSGLDGIDVRLLGPDGTDLPVQKRLKMEPRIHDEREAAAGLTAMRSIMCSETDARVALGGRVDGYAGRMPGVAEEVLLSLELRRPVFLLGCFGGCARDIAEALGLVGRQEGFAAGRFWPGRREMGRYGAGDLQNWLYDAENRELAGAPHVGQAIPLVLEGLSRLRAGMP